MNIVFFGTSEFAIPSLREILKSRHKVLALVTQPDRKRGRNLKVSPPPTKVLARTKDILAYQPEDASTRDSIDFLRGLSPDLFVVVSFGQILKKELLDIPKLYAINLHGSLLPEYRGAAPTNWAIINGDDISGVSVIKMNEKMDEGDIILKKEVKIDERDTNITLSETLSEVGAKALLEVLDSIADDKDLNFKPQDSTMASYAPKLKKEDGLIDWNESSTQIDRKVRGLIPWPGAYTHYEGKILKILETEISDTDTEGGFENGEVLDVVKGKGIIVRSDSGNLTIRYLQLEGKKILDADSFIRGHKISKGYRFV